MEAWQQVADMVSETEFWELTSFTTAGSRQRELDMNQDYNHPKPTPVTYFVQQGHTSQTFLNIATIWGPSVPISEPIGDSLI